ncbi:MAG: rhombotarget lipoprotein [Acidobacteria bacterium]|uniref:Rhombotarget lipoprotein n=1 Tax=Candidatus Polarisedimenticola svalbardensis TaxID=2886004 RepID=A0A8J6Y7M2_9BACT|nr:rhombotarget lipoprotein [Candidatus Polarisedimenticola svalbardensis]
MKTRAILMLSVILLAVVTLGCATRQKSISSNAFEYLYPEGSDGTPENTVSLELPLRVGVAFAPGTDYQSTLTAAHQSDLLERIAGSFRDREMVERIEVVPGHYLTRGGGFEEMNRIKTALGLDLIVLVSYDQHQFTDPGLSSFTYLTVVGAYIVKGSKQDTATMVDAAVFDIESKALLFRAAGESNVKNRSTGMGEDKAWRKASGEGFDEATVALVANLDEALEQFTVQAASGTVRGKGTPKLSVTASPGYQGSLGGGAAGWAEIAALATLLAGGMILRRVT